MSIKEWLFPEPAPCARCGVLPCIEQLGDDDYFAHCPECSLSTGGYWTRRGAVRAWNNLQEMAREIARNETDDGR